MKKAMKRVLILALAVFMLAGMIPTIAMADYVNEWGETVPDWKAPLYKPDLKPGDLIKVGAAEHLAAADYNYYNDICAKIQFVDTSSFIEQGYDYWQYDFFIMGKGVELSGLPVLTYSDGTVVTGTWDKYSDGEHATLTYYTNQGSAYAELFFDLRVTTDSSVPTWSFVFSGYEGAISREVIASNGWNPDVSYKAPARVVNKEGSVFDLIIWDKSNPGMAISKVWPLPAATGGNTVTPPTTPWSKASDWAVTELNKARDKGLIPSALNGLDYTKPITRLQYVGVAVKLYEQLSGKTAIPVAVNPFTDTNDVDVLKAYNVGLTSGTSATTFSPNSLLTREQASTMLTRAYKAASLDGWTAATDSKYVLDYTKPANFADDADISDWAKPSVYYMAAQGIVQGVGGNKFSPQSDTTIEQALLISVRMVEKLKGTVPKVTKAAYIYGYDRVDTAIAISQSGWDSAKSVILAPGGDANLVDALASAP
jgi:hypothetical protein